MGEVHVVDLIFWNFIRRRDAAMTSPTRDVSTMIRYSPRLKKQREGVWSILLYAAQNRVRRIDSSNMNKLSEAEANLESGSFISLASSI